MYITGTTKNLLDFDDLDLWWEEICFALKTPLLVTVITVSIGTDRHHTLQHLIRVYTVFHAYSNVVDFSRGSRMD